MTSHADGQRAGQWPSSVRIVEVGPRDGLQNEATILSTADKIQFIDLLSAAGLPVVEAGSFVRPDAVPQLADTADVLGGITRHPGTTYPVLVPNQRGLDRALACGVQEIAVFAAASESFSQANIRQSIAASLATYRPVVEQAQAAQVRVRGYISTCFGCPYEGVVALDQVLRVALVLREMGADELSIGDTIGVATPRQIDDVFTLLLRNGIPTDKLALHAHDTRGTALANILHALTLGITIFDASAGGAGGCPFAPGAGGNVATEDLLYMLHGMGIATGVDLEGVVAASRFLEARLGHPLPSRYLAAIARAM